MPTTPPPPTEIFSHRHLHAAPITADAPENLSELCACVHARVQAFLDKKPNSQRFKDVQAQMRRSLGVLGEALERYSLDELSLSYNGGKDCLVLLILYLSALHTHHSKNHSTASSQPDRRQQTLPSTLQSVYIVSPLPFPAIETFVTRTAETYQLSLSRYALPMRDAFTAYTSENVHIRAIFVGTRRTDPHGADLAPFAQTDHGWPSFMRIHPVLDWHYAEVWTFLRELGVPYCGLYDEGYTSLGGTQDTNPNPALKREDGGYSPAFELEKDAAERLGRVR